MDPYSTTNSRSKLRWIACTSFHYQRYQVLNKLGSAENVPMYIQNRIV